MVVHLQLAAFWHSLDPLGTVRGHGLIPHPPVRFLICFLVHSQHEAQAVPFETIRLHSAALWTATSPGS